MSNIYSCQFFSSRINTNLFSFSPLSVTSKSTTALPGLGLVGRTPVTSTPAFGPRTGCYTLKYERKKIVIRFLKAEIWLLKNEISQVLKRFLICFAYYIFSNFNENNKNIHFLILFLYFICFFYLMCFRSFSNVIFRATLNMLNYFKNNKR